MELKWAHLCTKAFWEGTGAGVLNLIGQFGADVGKPPALPNPTHLAVRVVGSAEEARNEVLQAVLTDENDQPIGSPIIVPTTYQALGRGYPTLGGGEIRLDNRYDLPSIGAYSVDLTFDSTGGELIGRVPHTIAPRQGKSIKPKLHNIPPIRLAWAHFLLRFDEKIAGLPTLYGIFEYAPLQTGNSRLNVKGWVLLLEIHADLTLDTNHQLRVDLMGSSGQAKDANGRPILPKLRPITLRRPSLGLDLLVSTAPVRIEEDLWLPPGKYQFEFRLDDQPLGQPLDFAVIPAPQSA